MDEVYYIIEYWTDEYDTLQQAIKYLVDDPRHKNDAEHLLNPNMTKLKSRTYYNIKNEVIEVEKF